MVGAILTTFGIVIAALIIVGGVIWTQRPVEGIVATTPIARPQANVNATGDPNAPVKIISWAEL